MSTQVGPVARAVDSYDHLAPVLARWAGSDVVADDRNALRAELTMAFLPVVNHIAGRYGGRGESLEDLRQAGMIGLLGALDRFVAPPDAADLAGAFLAFAVPTITGEIRKHFRDRTWSVRVPRRMKDLQGPIRQATAALHGALGRAPRPSEIAARLDVTLDEVLEALQAGNAYTSTSIDAPIGPSGNTVADLHGNLDAALELAAYRRELRVVLDELPMRERTILLLRFFGDKTQSQIAEEMGMSQMHVSRLLSRTLAALRLRMGADASGPTRGAAAPAPRHRD